MTDSPSRPKPIVEEPSTATLPPPPDLPTIYRSEFAYVWKTLRRLGAPPRDLEDLAHDVFVVVHRHLRDYDPARPLRPWLFGIAVRVVSDFRHLGRNLHEFPGERIEAIDSAPTAYERVETMEARALLMKALDTLDFERRTVFVMHDLDEVPVPEIATTLSIPLNTAYSRLRLAREALALWLERYRSAERGRDDR